jgi:hypothetical protein
MKAFLLNLVFLAFAVSPPTADAQPLSLETYREIQRELRQKSSAADVEIASRNEALADLVGEFVRRNDLYSRLKGFAEVNEKIRLTLRSTC